jgi:hypothetical protein
MRIQMPPIGALAQVLMRLTSLTPGTGCNACGCFVPDLTRLGALPCGEARRGGL